MKSLEALKNINYKDVAARALWTFLQTFIATFLLAGINLVNLLFAASWRELWALALATTLSAIAAGLSAAKTIIIELVKEMRDSVSYFADKPMNSQKITITKSSLYFRECKACGCVTLHVGKVTPQMPAGSTYNDCLQCLVDTHSVPGLSRWHDPKTGKLLVEPRGKTPPVAKS